MNLYSQYFNQILDQMSEIKLKQKDWEERIFKEWQKTFDMPRKIKKKRRKELQLEYQICKFDPLEGLLGEGYEKDLDLFKDILKNL